MTTKPNFNFMRSLRKISILIICTILLVSNSSAHIAFGVNESDLQQANDELDKLKKELSDLSGELSDLTTTLNNASAKLNEIDRQILAKQTEIDNLNKDIENYNNQIKARYAAMSLRIKYLYENSSNAAMDMIFGASDMSDMLNGLEYVAQLSSYDQNKMGELSVLVSDCDKKINELNTSMAALGTLKNEAVAESDRIKSLIAAKKEEIDVSSDKVENAEKIALAYEKAIEEQRIAEQQAQINSGITGGSSYSGGYEYDETDLAMLAAIIECEAGNQTYDGMVAVGNVVMNRVSDPRFPGTIYGVLYSPNQFSPVSSGRFAIVLARGAKESCVNAAKDALDGVKVVDALYFHMYRPSIDFGGTVIGDHVFY